MYIAGYMQQVSLYSIIHHHYPDTVNLGNNWSPISQVRILFGIYHLLGFISDTLSYNLYIIGYLQQIPFSHNINHPTQTFWYIFCRSFFNFQKNYRISRAFVLLRNVWSTIWKEWNKCSIIWYRIYIWMISFLTIFC